MPLLWGLGYWDCDHELQGTNPPAGRASEMGKIRTPFLVGLRLHADPDKRLVGCFPASIRRGY